MDRDVRGLAGLLAGLFVGIPASYYLQSGMIRAKLSLGSYVTHLPELLKNYGGDVFPPLLLSCAVLGTVGWFVGRRGGSTA
jgi:hypothetical protein